MTSDFDPIEMAMRNTRLAAERDVAIAERDGARGQNFVLDQELKAARAALKRIRHESHWTTVHEIIDEALKP